MAGKSWLLVVLLVNLCDSARGEAMKRNQCASDVSTSSSCTSGDGETEKEKRGNEGSSYMQEFKEIDLNGNGLIEDMELMKFAPFLTRSDIDAFVKQNDGNRDGMIDIDEFLKGMVFVSAQHGHSENSQVETEDSFSNIMDQLNRSNTTVFSIQEWLGRKILEENADAIREEYFKVAKAFDGAWAS